MQVENDYDKEVYNSDLGVVSRIDMEAPKIPRVIDLSHTGLCQIANARGVSERSWQKINKRIVVRDFYGTGRRVKPDVCRQLHASEPIPQDILAHVVVVAGHKLPSDC